MATLVSSIGKKSIQPIEGEVCGVLLDSTSTLYGAKGHLCAVVIATISDDYCLCSIELHFTGAMVV